MSKNMGEEELRQKAVQLAKIKANGFEAKDVLTLDSKNTVADSTEGVRDLINSLNPSRKITAHEVENGVAEQMVAGSANDLFLFNGRTRHVDPNSKFYDQLLAEEKAKVTGAVSKVVQSAMSKEGR
ncbi:MAG: hypothetical protein IJ660_07670 [Alphaproteobacteria bacterium]|nr:hypothetical protein [Alphaproteobacteria bacterium]